MGPKTWIQLLQKWLSFFPRKSGQYSWFNMMIKPFPYKKGPPNYYKWMKIPSYTHLQPWLNRVCWGYNYLITTGGPSCTPWITTFLGLINLPFLGAWMTLQWLEGWVSLNLYYYVGGVLASKSSKWRWTAFEGSGSLGYINSKIHLTNRYWAKDLVKGKSHLQKPIPKTLMYGTIISNGNQ